ncbi:hypothetical protein V6N12_062060 [Hibiscus sabdariffa]|uniref:EF-hand domain-containing protein n=1 Tax=Hibiscus sabdariffa TaxID=183260 RepID=A0ABR2AQP8_9ROSI
MHRSADFPRLNARMNCSNCSMRSNCKGCMSKCFPVPLTKAQVKAILQRFDSDGDCRLSKKELESALLLHRVASPRLASYPSAQHC